MHRDTHTDTFRHTQRHSQTQTQTHSYTHTDADTHSHTEADTQIYAETQRDTDTDTHKHPGYIQTHTDTDLCCFCGLKVVTWAEVLVASPRKESFLSHVALWQRQTNLQGRLGEEGLHSELRQLAGNPGSL
jgi:hypothetical protein